MLKFTLRNVGHSVAQYVRVWTALEMTANWPAAQERICAIPKAPVNEKSDYGYLIFPGQIVMDTIPASATAEHAKQALADSPFTGGGMVELNVLICVDYKSALGPGRHQTRRALGVAYPDRARNGILMGAFKPGQTMGN